MSPRDRIPLTSITALTLRSDSRTTFRRTSAVPQLTCRGKGCRQFQPSVVQCVPVGSSGSGVEWKCEADLPSNLSFGSIEVSCEGYDSPDDPYVLRGSCGLTYNLVPSSSSYNDSYSLPSPSNGLSIASLLSYALVAYAAYTIYRAFFGPRAAAPRLPTPVSRFFSGWGGGPGGGGGGGGGPGFGGGRAPPPPPYSKYTEQPPAAAGGGFWTGLASGAAAMYAANALRNSQQQQRGYGGYGNAYGSSRDDYDRGVGGSGYGGASRNGGSAMRPSTGFGGTNNR